MLHRVAALAVLAGTVVLASAPSVHASTRVQPFNPVPPGWPRLIAIPRMGIRAPIESLALNRASDYKAPYRWGDVAWYDRGPRPGDMGRANMLGHVDSYCCPAVFYKLRDLRKGDKIYVAYRDGQVVAFQYQWQNVYWDNKLPLKWMFANTRERGLILTTCTGVFHRDGTGYDHKRIVYATMIWPARHK